MCVASAAHFLILGEIDMEKYIYPGFDKIDENDARNRMIPFCDMLYDLVGERDMPYISESLYPVQLIGLILAFLEHKRGVPHKKIEAFSSKYLTEDWLCPPEKVIDLWGYEKLDAVITELREMLLI